MHPGLKMLILDDDPRFRKTLSDILRSRGFAPQGAAKGKTALKKIQRQRPSVVLIDLKLEDMDGISAMKEIKTLSPSTECIIITGHSSQSSAIEAVNLGAYSYLQKPLDVDLLLVTLQRVAEKKRMEELLKMSEAQYRAIFEHTGAASIIIEEDMTLSLINSEAERFSGYSRKEVEGRRKWTEFVVADDLRRMKEYHRLRRMRPDLAPKTYEARFIDKSGNVRDILLTVGMISGTGKSVASMIDITEEKKAEEEIRDYQKKLHALAIRLSEVEESEKRKLASHLHDATGQSLALARIKLSALEKSLCRTPQAASVKDVKQLIDSAIRDIRELTFELSPPLVHRQTLEGSVRWLAAQFRDRHDLAVSFRDDGQPKPVGDALRVILFHGVRELLLNTLKHSRAKKVRVSARRAGGEIRICVEDNGVGFNPLKFNPFSAKAGGFGLFHIRERLQECRGTLKIVSQVGRGTRVTLSAPLVRQEK